MATLLDETSAPIEVTRAIIVTPEDPDSDSTMHQWAHARVLKRREDQPGTFVFQRVSNSRFTGFEDPPPGFSLLAGSRAGWWKHTAIATGDLLMSAEGETEPLQVMIFSELNGAWQQVASMPTTLTDDEGYYLNYQFTMIAGHTYYIRLSNVGSDDTVQYQQLSGHAVASPVDNTQHQWTNAVEILRNPDGIYDDNVDTTPDAFTNPEINPTTTPDELLGTRSAWWKMAGLRSNAYGFNAEQVGGSGFVSITASGGSSPIELDVVVVYQDGTISLNTSGYSTDPNQDASIAIAVSAGATYYFRIAETGDTDTGGQSYTLHVDNMPQPIPNHSYLFAHQIVGDAFGNYTDDTVDTSTDGYADPETDFTLDGLTGERGAWWTLTLNTAEAQAIDISAVGLVRGIYTIDVYDDTWARIMSASSTAVDEPALLTIIADGDRTYYVRVADATGDGGQPIELHASGLPTSSAGDVVAAPLIIVEVAVLPASGADSINNQHQYTHAVQILPDYDGYFDVSADNAHFTRTEAVPPASDPSLPGYLASWWYLDVTWTGDLNFEASGDDNLVSAIMYDGTSAPWDILAQSYGGSGATISVYQGQRIYFRVANLNSTDGQIVHLSGTTPVHNTEENPAPPIVVTIDAGAPRPQTLKSAAKPIIVTVATPRGHVVGDVDIVEVPPLVVEVSEAPAATPPTPLAVAPMTVGAGILPADIRRIRYGIIDPPDLSVLPVAAPTLSGYVNIFEGDVDDPGDIAAEFEYGVGTGDNYMRLGLIAEPVEIYTSYSLVEATLPALTAGTIYYWRMRIVVDGEARTPSVWWSFKVGAVLESALPVDATVTAAPTAPQLWFIDPPVAAPGETVTLVGYGFPEHETGATFGDQVLDIVSWDHIPATAAASTADRLITPEQIDPAHDEVQVIVPDTEEAGAAVTVLGEDD